MTSLDIKITTHKLLDYSGSLRKTIDERTLSLLLKSFAVYVSDVYGAMIEESINSRRYKGKWEPVDDPGYIEYLGTTPETPIIYLIKDAMSVRNSGSNYIVCFDSKYKYPGSKLTLVKVLRAIDSGTSDFNARPILSKIIRKIRSNIYSLWRGYLKRLNIA